jgi:copper(I)-binding protein
MQIAQIAGGVLAVSLTTGLAAPTLARPAHGLAVANAWTRPVPAGLQTGVVYMTIANPSPTPDKLIDASTPVAAKMDLHRSTMVRGRMSMDPVPGGLAIPANGQVEIAPNGYHYMLIGLTQGLTVGASFPVTLRFAHAGVVRVKVQVRAAPPEPMNMPGMR